MLKTIRITLYRARIWICAIATAFVALDALPAEWDAEKIATMTTKNVQLMGKNQNVLGVVSVEQIRRLVAIRDKLSPISGIHPRLIITVGDSPNAYATNATGTNIVAFNTGMLQLLGPDNDALAAIMGHEMGHLVKGHLEEKGSRDVFLGIAGLVLGIALDRKIANRTGVGSNLGQHLASIGTSLVSRKFDRDQEREADAVGVSWMHAAGYDPAGALRIWEKTPSRASDFFATHPTPDDRLANIRNQIAGLASVRQTVIASASQIGTQAELSSATSNAEFNEVASGSDDPVVLGLKAVRERRFFDAFNFATQAAKKGDPRGQLGLGYLHFYGLGTGRDYKKAAEWFEMAAAQGSATADTFLGILRENGFGFPQDFVKAAAYYQKASDAGYPTGMARYAQLKMLGLGVPKDTAGAIELAKKAAISNDPLADYVIGLAYYRGEGLTQDAVMAKQHFELASRHGFAAADVRVREIYVSGTGVASQAEEAQWSNTKMAGTRDAFEAYLRDYPEGRYADLAKANVAMLLYSNSPRLPHGAGDTPDIEKLSGKFVGYITTSLMPGSKLHGVIDIGLDGKFSYKGENGTLITGTLAKSSQREFTGVGEAQLPKILGFIQMKYPGGASTARVQMVGKNNAGVVEGTFSTLYERGEFYFGGAERKP